MPSTRTIRTVSIWAAVLSAAGSSLNSVAFAQTTRDLPLTVSHPAARAGERLDTLENQREKLTTLRRELQERIDQQQIERQELLAKQALVELWRKSTFALLSQRTAVALQAESDGDLKVLATAHFPESDYIAQLIHRFNIPCLAQDDRLTESLARQEPGSLVAGKSREQLGKYWCRHKYVPVSKHESPKYVLFHDMERKASRVGLLVDLKGDSLVFQPVGSRAETIQRPRIQSGSAKAGDAKRIKGEEGVDFLDLCVLQAAQLLETDENVPSFQAVALTVKIDELEEALKLSKEMDHSWRDSWFDYVARSNNVPFVRDQRKEPARILREFGLSLEDQLRSRLGELGIPLVEREELASITEERKLSKTEEFDQRNYRKLVSASHMVIAEVGRPTAGGAFRIDVRLVDINSGNVLFEDSDDIGKPTSKLATMFNVQAGNLMVLSSRTEKKPTASGNRQKPLLLDAFDERVPSTRLVRLERATDTDYHYYDLFENAPKTVSRDSTAMLPASGAAMPRDEKLRWISWQIFNATMPAAGKVLTADNRRVTLNIGSTHGIKNGDTFRVVRLRESSLEAGGVGSSAAESILPVEIRADEVSTNHSTAFIVESEVSQLWNDYQVEPGDVVLRQGTQDVNIQLLPPVTDTRHWQADVARKANGWGTKQKMRLAQKLGMFGKAFIDSTTSGLQQVGVVTSSEFDGQTRASVNAATHQVVCYVAPLTGYTECSQFSLKLEIKDSRSGQLLQSIGPIQFHESEVLNWRP